MVSLRLFRGGPSARLYHLLAPERVDASSIGVSTGLSVSLSWLPMLLLAALQGIALRANPRESMMLDTALLARYWVALPALLLTPAVCDTRLNAITQHFLDTGMVRDSERQQFAENVEQATRAADSGARDALLLIVSYAYSLYLVLGLFPILPPSWRTLGPPEAGHLSWAAWWMVAVSHPLYLFIQLRTVYGILLWWRFLWRTARLDLQLIASHADEAGGIGFLALSLPKFGLPAFGFMAGFAGGVAGLVLGAGTTLADYKYTVLALAATLMLLFAGPLLFFYGPLKKAKVRGKFSYGKLEKRQLRRFEEKWMASEEARSDILGAQDFSAVIDFHSTVAAVQHMRAVPFKRSDLLFLAVCTLAPFVPVLALEIPLDEILLQIMKLAA